MRAWALVVGAVVGAGLAFADPARAEFLPTPEQIALPGEQAVLREAFRRSFDDPGADQAKTMASLDAALAQLGQPTKLRGFIQFLRAGALWADTRHAAAREAADEAVRLLPGYSGPLLVASEFYSFSDQPANAVDYFIRASRIDPDLARRVESYTVGNMLRRLSFAGDERRAFALSERLVEIDWQGDSLGMRSSIAREVIEGRMAAGDVAGARSLVTRLVSPADARALLMQHRYSALWADVERWAGPKLESLWPQYLAESREKWAASKDPEAAPAYAGVLDTAGHDDTIIREFLPLFSKPIDAERDYDLLFVAPTLSGALARKGRWADVESMYGHALRAWPLGTHASALTIAANRARYVFLGGDARRGLELADAALADAARWKDEVNGDALAIMHQNRACMVHALGQDDPSILSRAAATSARLPASVANLYLCLDKPDAARAVLIRALAVESLRDDVLAYLQPDDGRLVQSERGRALWAKHQALKSDPELLKAVEAHGRVLPFSLGAGAPPEGG